ncbi:MAG: hypothetical protein JNK87_40165 [Bryobacterales bacterium]|nr:hypothetical protein [Bryobacterales bacterium]
MKRSGTTDAPKLDIEALPELLRKASRGVKINREKFFRGLPGKRVYAYSVYPKDMTLFVREDEAGNKTLGRLVGGRFRPVKRAQ